MQETRIGVEGCHKGTANGASNAELREGEHRKSGQKIRHSKRQGTPDRHGGQGKGIEADSHRKEKLASVAHGHRITSASTPHIPHRKNSELGQDNGVG